MSGTENYFLHNKEIFSPLILISPEAETVIENSNEDSFKIAVNVIVESDSLANVRIL